MSPDSPDSHMKKAMWACKLNYLMLNNTLKSDILSDDALDTVIFKKTVIYARVLTSFVT